MASAPPASKHVRALASVVTSAAADLLLDVPQVQAVARAIQNALQVCDRKYSFVDCWLLTVDCFMGVDPCVGDALN